MGEVLCRGGRSPCLTVCEHCTASSIAQELHDLAATAELFTGDALCFASVACLATHLPYTLRTIALDRARGAVRRCGVPVSRPRFVCENDTTCNEPTATSASAEEAPVGDAGRDAAVSTGPTATTSTTILGLERYRVENFATGVLTNLMQLQNWAYPPDTAVEDDGGDNSCDESDGGRGWGSGGGGDPRVKNASAAAGLPFHPAFLDAAVLTLSTPKWPLILDPEGIALR